MFICSELSLSLKKKYCAEFRWENGTLIVVNFFVNVVNVFK